MAINSKSLVLLVALSLTATGCLKTRAQLHGDGDVVDDTTQRSADKTPGASQPVQDVVPQGGYAIDEVKSEITRLEGRIEDLERSQKQAGETATQAGSDQQKKLEARVVELEQAQAQMIETIKKLESGAATAAAAPTPELFDKAKAQYDSGQYDVAIETFSAYMKSPKAPHQEDATFLRAEAYFAQKEYKKAIVDYSRFPEKFTKSKRMPAALLRIGESFDALGMHDDAKGFYGELVEKFAKSPEAKKARARLKS
jgi:tol-pal system protein YbgF